MTIHDPCFYGRYLKLSEGPRQVLSSLGLEYVEVRNCGEFTSCCGGPAESVSPALNREILGRRVAELQASGAPVVTCAPSAWPTCSRPAWPWKTWPAWRAGIVEVSAA